MSTSRSERILVRTRPVWLTLAVLATLPVLAQGQIREVVSSRIGVSGDEATLHLEFADEGRLEIAFIRGSIRVDGEAVGEYQGGSPLEVAWRALLGRAVSLDDGPLAEELRSWEPPGELSGSEAELAGLVDTKLEESLTAAAREEAQEPIRIEVSGVDSVQGAVVSALLGRTDRLRDLAEALESLDLDDVQVRVGQDVRVESDTRLDASLVVVGANAEVAGEVRGHVVVVDGDLRLLDGSRVTGDIRLAGARLFRAGGVVEGRVRAVGGPGVATDPESLRGEIERRVRSELRGELRDELRAELRNEIRGGTRSAFRNPLRNLLQGFGGLIENVIGFAILSALGLGVIYFAREKLEVVAEAVLHEPGRSAVVGLAGSFLLLPVWILGTIALLVSIVGIPVAIAWIPLFPLAAVLAAGLGYLAVALLVGDWVGERNIQGLEWIRGANPFYRLVAGIGTLMLAFAAANVAHMGGSWLDFMEGLFVATGSLATMAAMVVGFGAVILTRGGRQPTSASVPDLDFGASEWRGEASANAGEPDPPEGPGGGEAEDR